MAEEVLESQNSKTPSELDPARPAPPLSNLRLLSRRHDRDEDVWQSSKLESAQPSKPVDSNGKHVNRAAAVVADIATLKVDDLERISKTGATYIRALWLLLVMSIVPAFVAMLWFVAVPLGNTWSDQFKDKAIFIFLINPGTQCITSYLIIQLFMATIDEERPWRPFKNFVGIIIGNYVAQLLVPGLVVALVDPFKVLGLVALTVTLLVTYIGLRITPSEWLLPDHAKVVRYLSQFRKTLIVFFTMVVVLVCYIVLFDRIGDNAQNYIEEYAEENDIEEDDAILRYETDPEFRYRVEQFSLENRGEGIGQGFLTFALTIITFTLKKFNLAFTDLFPIEVAMVMSGLWLENLVDLFITLAYPTVTSPGATFAIIWVIRIVENLAYLVFQTDHWFKFRIWIKGKFKKDQNYAIEEDVNPDDRGHSNQRPGYLRRQLRFLLFKLFSQCSSAVFFLTVIPALRFCTYNNLYYPYISQESALQEAVEQRPWFSQVENNIALYGLDEDGFRSSIYFALASFVSVAVCIFLVYKYMLWKHRSVIESLAEKYSLLVVESTYLNLILTVLISNVMLAVSAISLPYRMYFV